MADLDPDVKGHLRELADIDAMRRRLRHQLATLPEVQQLADADTRRAEVQVARDELALTADAVRDRARREDREVKTLRERLAAEQQKMYAGTVTNPREHASMQAEIDSVTRRIDEHETAELEALEELDTLDEGLAGHDAELSELGLRMATLEVSRDESSQSLNAQMAELGVARDVERAALPTDIVDRYDHIDGRTRAGAVGELEGSRCTGCGIELPYVEVDELIHGPPLPACPNCQRMLLT